MDKNSEDLSWLWQKKFVKQAFPGAVGGAILVFNVTSPWIIKPLHEAEVIVSMRD